MFNQIMLYVAYGLGGVFILWFTFILYSITKKTPEAATALKEAKLAAAAAKKAAKAETSKGVFASKAKPAKKVKTVAGDNIGEGAYVPDLSVSNIARDGEDRKKIENPFTRPKVSPFQAPTAPVSETNAAPSLARAEEVVETEVKPKLATQDLSLDSIKTDEADTSNVKPATPRFNLPY